MTTIKDKHEASSNAVFNTLKRPIEAVRSTGRAVLDAHHIAQLEFTGRHALDIDNRRQQTPLELGARTLQLPLTGLKRRHSLERDPTLTPADSITRRETAELRRMADPNYLFSRHTPLGDQPKDKLSQK